MGRIQRPPRQHLSVPELSRQPARVATWQILRQPPHGLPPYGALVLALIIWRVEVVGCLAADRHVLKMVGLR